MLPYHVDASAVLLLFLPWESETRPEIGRSDSRRPVPCVMFLNLNTPVEERTTDSSIAVHIHIRVHRQMLPVNQPNRTYIACKRPRSKRRTDGGGYERHILQPSGTLHTRIEVLLYCCTASGLVCTL